MSDDDYDNYGKVGNAGAVCSSGRSKGTPATRPFSHHWNTDICDRKWGDEYESPWRERKEVRKENRLDYEAGKDTPAVRMMKKIKYKPHLLQICGEIFGAYQITTYMSININTNLTNHVVV